MTAYRADDVAEVYLATFTPQRDRYQAWRPDFGRWDPVKTRAGDAMPLIAERFLEARSRGIPLGTYWTGAPSHVAALDFDAHDGWEQLRAVQRAFGDAGLPAYGERSRRGGHLWLVLATRLPAIALLHGCRAAVQQAGLDDADPKIEFRPADDRVHEWGSAMRLPMLPHQRTGDVSPLVDVDGRVLHERIAGMLLEIQLGHAEKMLSLAERLRWPADEGVFGPSRAIPHRSGNSPIARFNANVGVSAVLAREWGVSNARPGRAVRCPAHDDRNPSLSIAKDDSRAWCHSPGCELHGPSGAGHDAFSLATAARSRLDEVFA